MHAVSRSIWWLWTRAPKWELVCTTGRYDVKDNHAQWVAWWLTWKHNLRAEPTVTDSQAEQNSKHGGINLDSSEILIVQALQIGSSRSLGSWTSNKLLRAKTIIARQAVLHLAQMKYRYFVQECCKQNAIFSDTSHQNRSYSNNILTNWWHIVHFQQGHCSH